MTYDTTLNKYTTLITQQYNLHRPFKYLVHRIRKIAECNIT